MSINDFNYLSQECDSNILDLAKQKGFYLYEHMSDFDKLKEKLPRQVKKLTIMNMNTFLKFRIHFK